MPEILKLLAVLAVFALLIGALYLVVVKLELLKQKKGGESPKAEPYRCVPAFLSDGELAFYRDLVGAVAILTATAGEDQEPLLFAKPRLADVLATDSTALKRESETGGQDGKSVQSMRTGAHNSIRSKHIDFLICHPVTTKPMLVIELDDRSHDRPDRRERDEFLDRACAAANLAILHVPCRPPGTRYDPRQLAAAMKAKLCG